MKEKTEQKPKLDFSSRNGMLEAREILKAEGFGVKCAFNTIMLLSGTEEQAKKALNFAINQGWPVKHLSRVMATQKREVGKPPL